MLTLPIKKKWFDMIKSGEKKEEYREIKPYYGIRFENQIRKNKSCKFDIILRNGYSKLSPSIKCRIYIYLGYGKEVWGGNPHQKYYVLKILSVEEIC